MIDIEELTSEECLELVIDLVSTRVDVSSGYLINEETGWIDQHFFVLDCDGIQASSPPAFLNRPLIFATPEVTQGSVTVQ